MVRSSAASSLLLLALGAAVLAACSAASFGAVGASAAVAVAPIKLRSSSVSPSSSPSSSSVALAAGGGEDGCACSGDECACCAHVEASRLHLDGELCANVTVSEAQLAIDLVVSYNKDVLINETVSLLDPDLCLPVPILDNLIDVCVDFENVIINHKNQTVSGCIAIAFKLFDITVLEVKLGCFKLPIPLDALDVPAKRELVRQALARNLPLGGDDPLPAAGVQAGAPLR